MIVTCPRPHYCHKPAWLSHKSGDTSVDRGVHTFPKLWTGVSTVLSTVKPAWLSHKLAKRGRGQWKRRCACPKDGKAHWTFSLRTY